MKTLSKYLSGLSLRTLLLPLVLTGMVSLTACDNPLSLLTGGGPNVAANVQAGKTNSQTVGQTNNISPKTVVRPKARVETVDQSNKTTTNNELPPWVWIVGIFLFIVGWVTDTPATYVKRMIGKKDA